MTRTINSTLQTGLQTRTGQFISKVTFKRSTTTETVSVIKAFEINEGNLTAWVRIPFSNKPTTVNVSSSTQDCIFKISRGLRIGATEYLFDSSWFIVQSQIQSDEDITYHGHIFKNIHYSTSADIAANTLIGNILANSYVSGLGYSNTITYPTNAEWWKTIQFMPNGTTLRISNIQNFNQLLQQKYILNLFDIGGNVLIPLDNGQFNQYEFSANIEPLTSIATLSLDFQELITKYYIWIDELNVLHTSGSATRPQHNLGFIPSTITPFLLDEPSIGKVTATLTPPDLRLTAEDYITLSSPKSNITWSDWYRIKETFDPSKPIPWFQTLESIKMLANTEGGNLSSTIAKTIQFLQLNTSNFNNMLSANENNAQAAFDSIDVKATPIIRGKTAAPGSGDDSADGYVIGHIWIDETADDAYICLNNAAGAAVWKKMTP